MVLQHDEDIIDILANYLQDIELEEDLGKPITYAVPELTFTHDGGSHDVPKKFFETLLAGEIDELLSLKSLHGARVFSEWLAILRFHDRSLGPAVVIVGDDPYNQPADYEIDGVFAGSDKLNPQLFAALKNRAKIELEKASPPVKTHPAKDGKTPILGTQNCLIKTTVPVLNKIDLNKGQGQYIGGNLSEDILQQDWVEGMTRDDRNFCEYRFRLWTKRKRIDKLRSVYHTKPSERGKFGILTFTGENLVFLYYMGRLLTLGKFSELPRTPDWRVASLNSGSLKSPISPKTTRSSVRFFVLSPNEDTPGRDLSPT